MRAVLSFEAAIEAAAGTTQPVGREHAGELALIAEENTAPDAEESFHGSADAWEAP